MAQMRTSKAVSLANHEIVTLAVFLLGGDTQRVDTEDIAVKANELAHGRFTWRKYPDQINIDAVRKNAGLFKTDKLVVWEYVANGLQYTNPGTNPVVKVTLDSKTKRITSLCPRTPHKLATYYTIVHDLRTSGLPRWQCQAPHSQ